MANTPPERKRVSRRTFDRHVKRKVQNTVDLVQKSFARGARMDGTPEVTIRTGLDERARAHIRRELQPYEQTPEKPRPRGDKVQLSDGRGVSAAGEPRLRGKRVQ